MGWEKAIKIFKNAIFNVALLSLAIAFFFFVLGTAGELVI